MTIKEYILENLSPDEIQDVAKHGCSGGVGGFIYYHETSEFHDKFEDEIWDLLWNDADNQGLTIIEFIKTWSGQKDVGSMAQFKNLLCWYAVERICADLYVWSDKNE
jgi:hypothetical protein